MADPRVIMEEYIDNGVDHIDELEEELKKIDEKINKQIFLYFGIVKAKLEKKLDKKSAEEIYLMLSKIRKYLYSVIKAYNLRGNALTEAQFAIKELGLAINQCKRLIKIF
jgi:hypothetical protein